MTIINNVCTPNSISPASTPREKDYYMTIINNVRTPNSTSPASTPREDVARSSRNSSINRVPSNRPLGIEDISETKLPKKPDILDDSRDQGLEIPIPDSNLNSGEYLDPDEVYNMFKSAIRERKNH